MGEPWYLQDPELAFQVGVIDERMNAVLGA
jgi:hypothetical protein